MERNDVLTGPGSAELLGKKPGARSSGIYIISSLVGGAFRTGSLLSLFDAHSSVSDVLEPRPGTCLWTARLLTGNLTGLLPSMRCFCGQRIQLSPTNFRD